MAEEKNVLDGLNYQKLELHENAHKIIGKVTSIGDGKQVDNEIDEQAFWLAAGLGYLSKELPDNILAESLQNTIIVDKVELIKFIKNKLNE